jgi:L-rhamnose mutarotase
MAAAEVNARWQRQMAPSFEDIEGRPDEAMAPLREIFHLS